MATKICNQCKQERRDTWFRKGRRVCRTCEAMTNNARSRERGHADRHFYGIEPNQKAALLESQNGLCAVCRLRPPTELDHDHSQPRGQGIRGLLCDPCNRALGLLKDDPAIVQRAAEYLRRGPVDLAAPVRVEHTRQKKQHICGMNNACPGESVLREMYDTKPVREISKLLDVQSPSVYWYLRAHDISLRGPKTTSARTAATQES